MHGIAVLLAFDCLLRVGELCNIRKCDIADAGDPRIGKEYTGTAIRLPKTKTGANQWVTVEDKHVITLLRLLMTHTQNDQSKLFTFSTSFWSSNVIDSISIITNG
jgi:integrase